MRQAEIKDRKVRCDECVLRHTVECVARNAFWAMDEKRGCTNARKK